MINAEGGIQKSTSANVFQALLSHFWAFDSFESTFSRNTFGTFQICKCQISCFPPLIVLCSSSVVPQRPCTAHLSPATKSWLDWGMTETLQDINICFKPFLCGFGFLFQSFLRWKINLLNHGSLKKKRPQQIFRLEIFCFIAFAFTSPRAASTQRDVPPQGFMLLCRALTSGREWVQRSFLQRLSKRRSLKEALSSLGPICCGATGQTPIKTTDGWVVKS